MSALGALSGSKYGAARADAWVVGSCRAERTTFWNSEWPSHHWKHRGSARVRSGRIRRSLAGSILEP